MNFTKHDVTAMHAELAATRERVHKLILAREIAASYRLDQINHLRLQDKLAAWRRTNGFDRSEVLSKRQCRFRSKCVRSMIRSTPKSNYIVTRDSCPPFKNLLRVYR